MMNADACSCRRTEVLIHRRLDAEIAVGECRELDLHVSSCPACEQALLASTAIESLAGDLLVPDSFKARNRLLALLRTEAEKTHQEISAQTVARMGVIYGDDALTSGSGGPERARRGRWLALAAMVLIAFVLGVAAHMNFGARDSSLAKRDPNVGKVDRIQTFEVLNRDLLRAAALQPGPLQARHFEDLADDLLVAVVCADHDPQMRRQVSDAYVRTIHDGLVPAIRAGWVPSERAPFFEARRARVEQINREAEAALMAAEAISAYATDLLVGRTDREPLVHVPASDGSMIAALIEGAVAMGDVVEPDGRAKVLNDIADRAVRELDAWAGTPQENMRMQRMILDLSAKGVHVLLRRRVADEERHAQYVLLLDSDALRLRRLEDRIERIPEHQQPELAALYARVRSSNHSVRKALLEVPPLRPQAEVSAPSWQIPAVDPDLGAPFDSRFPAPERPRLEPSIRIEKPMRPDAPSPGAQPDEPARFEPQGAEGASERPSLRERPERPEFPEAPRRLDRPERLDRPTRPERLDRPTRPERVVQEKQERPVGNERPAKPDRPDVEGGPGKAEATEVDVPERPDAPQRPIRPFRPVRPQKADLRGTPGVPDRPGQAKGKQTGGGPERNESWGKADKSDRNVQEREKPEQGRPEEHLERPEEHLERPEAPDANAGERIEGPSLDVPDVSPPPAGVERPEPGDTAGKWDSMERPEQEDALDPKDDLKVPQGEIGDQSGGLGGGERPEHGLADAPGVEVEGPERPSDEHEINGPDEADGGSEGSGETGEAGDMPKHPNRPGRPGKEGKPERPRKPNHSDRPAKPEKPEFPEKEEIPELPEKQKRPDHPGKGNRPERAGGVGHVGLRR